jgi:cytochrome c oxidase assembly factor CtaG
MFVNLAKGNSLMLGMKDEEVLKICYLPCVDILYKIGIFSGWNIPFYFRGKFYQRR